jgi:hypothetical protein
MDLAAYEDLLSRVESLISKCATRFRRSIDARERLCLTIRHLVANNINRVLLVHSETMKNRTRLTKLLYSTLYNDLFRYNDMMIRLLLHKTTVVPYVRNDFYHGGKNRDF